MADEEKPDARAPKKRLLKPPKMTRLRQGARAGSPARTAAVAATPAMRCRRTACPRRPGRCRTVSRRKAMLKTGFWGGMGVMLRRSSRRSSTACTRARRRERRSAAPRHERGQPLRRRHHRRQAGPARGRAEDPQPRRAAPGWCGSIATQAAHNPGAQEGSILALYHKCAHLGCTVPWRADFTREDPRNGETYARLVPLPVPRLDLQRRRRARVRPGAAFTGHVRADHQSGKMEVDTSKITTRQRRQPVARGSSRVEAATVRNH